MSEVRDGGRWAAVSFLIAFAVAGLAYWLSLAPSPVPASAPPEQFSAERAMAHVEVMAHKPHPAGSLENDKVRDYIVAQLHELGLEVEVVEEVMHRGGNSVAVCHAVLGRIRGTDSTKAFAVDAHYDSVPYGPGASDIISGVAAMIEAARAILAGPPLKNDIIFCFADQEEISAGGAKAFVEHPWFQEVGVLLGLEARGTKGPALMFETSQMNGYLIRELKKAGVHPRANSIMFDVYDRLPFGSDFGVYKHHVAGYNVAFIDNFAYYHISLDSPENLSMASLQHHGEYTLGLARHFGNKPIGETYAPNVTYFNTLGGHMVIYPQSWALPLAIAAILLFAGGLIYGFLRRRLRIINTLMAFFVVLLSALVAAAVAILLAYVLFVRYREMALYQNNIYCFSFACFAIASLLLACALFRRWIRPQEWLAGGLVWLAAGLVLMQWWIAGGAFAMLWPLVFGTIILFALCGAREEIPPAKYIAALTLLALPPLIILTPLIGMFGYALTCMAGFLLSIVIILLISLLLPQAWLIQGRVRWAAPLLLIVLGALVFAGGYLANRPGPKTPLLNCLSYGMDFDTGQGFWLSNDSKLDEFTAQFFPADTERQTVDEFMPGHQGLYLKAPAPDAPFPKPRLDIIEDRIEGGRRILRLHLDSPRDAQFINLHVTSETEVFGGALLGIPMGGAKPGQWRAHIELLPREGGELQLEVEPHELLIINIRERSYGVPEFPEYLPRPDWMATEPNRTIDHHRPLRSEHTWSTCTLNLGPGPSAT